MKMYEELINDFQEEKAILDRNRILSAFELILNIVEEKQTKQYSDVYDEACAFLKNNKNLVDNILISEGYRKRIKLFLFSPGVFFFINRLYNILLYRRNTTECL